jgi:hypothetical protein
MNARTDIDETGIVTDDAPGLLTTVAQLAAALAGIIALETLFAIGLVWVIVHTIDLILR